MDVSLFKEELKQRAGAPNDGSEYLRPGNGGRSRNLSEADTGPVK